MLEVRYMQEGDQEFTGEIKFEQWKFPVGEVGVKLIDPPENFVGVGINWTFENHDEYFVMINLIDALMAINSNVWVTLMMPYLPYSRQDRVCHPGESYALMVFLESLNGWIDNLMTLDVHNPEPITKAVQFGKFGFQFTNVHQHYLAASLQDYDYFVAPDAGAAKKIGDHLSVQSGRTKVITMTKSRVAGIVVHDPLPVEIMQGKVCVVDDLCDGGATFISVADEISKSQPEVEQLDLYVTHGFFTNMNNLFDLSVLYDTIYAFNVYRKAIPHNVKNLKELNPNAS